MGPIFTSLSSAIDPKLLSKKKFFNYNTKKKNFRNGSKIDVHHFISHRWLYCQSNWKGENTRAFCLVLVTAFRKKNFSVNLSRER